MTTQELLFALSAPVLAAIMLVIWLAMRFRTSGATSIHLRFLGLSLDVRSCEFSDAQCRRAISAIANHRGETRGTNNQETDEAEK